MTGIELAKLAWEEIQRTIGDVWERFTPEEKASAARLVVLYVQVEVEKAAGLDVSEQEDLIRNAGGMYADVGVERVKDAAKDAAWRIIKTVAGKVLSFA